MAWWRMTDDMDGKGEQMQPDLRGKAEALGEGFLGRLDRWNYVSKHHWWRDRSTLTTYQG